MSGSGGQSPAEQHLGDRLAALVDGELGHDTRERVLAHLATCWKCKAEADAQRRLKSVFAEAAPPPLSEGLLARLQGLPGAGLGGEDDEPGGPDSGGRGKGVFGVRAEAYALLPAPGRARDRGFRIHEVGRSRGRRFAFAAAGAVSIAAFALVGAQPLETAVEAPRARAEDPQVSATSLAWAPRSGAAGGRRTGPVTTGTRPLRPMGPPLPRTLVATPPPLPTPPPSVDRIHAVR
ncbi:zf-HC2 domain-containing protein [Streptomyces sp. NPDC052396]|uniref:zf-HC2 domain-containing protein n=1 Tax=Streptomyces sp. NPDC052396 TaxID=3365689 RepID=UPI0037CDCE84